MPDAALSAFPRERTPRQRWAAPNSGHDRRIKLLSFTLPVGVGVLAAFLVTAPIYQSGDVSFLLDKNKVAVARERLRIQSAQYRGQDGKGRPFTLDAGSGLQRKSAEPVVELQRLDARLSLADGPATLHADTGRYDMRSEQVRIDGPIQFRAADGYRLDTHDATVDMKTNRLASGGAVTGGSRQGTFSGNRLRADLEARTVTLDGNARLRIFPRGSR